MKKYRIINQFGAVVLNEGKPQVFDTREEADEAFEKLIAFDLLTIEEFIER